MMVRESDNEGAIGREVHQIEVEDNSVHEGSCVSDGVNGLDTRMRRRRRR